LTDPAAASNLTGNGAVTDQDAIEHAAARPTDRSHAGAYLEEGLDGTPIVDVKPVLGRSASGRRSSSRASSGVQQGSAAVGQRVCPV
jgi:hypothetical protein